jgi:hypothetical protein
MCARAWVGEGEVSVPSTCFTCGYLFYKTVSEQDRYIEGVQGLDTSSI